MATKVLGILFSLKLPHVYIYIYIYIYATRSVYMQPSKAASNVCRNDGGLDD
jgi:hypothetical protein